MLSTSFTLATALSIAGTALGAYLVAGGVALVLALEDPEGPPSWTRPAEFMITGLVVVISVTSACALLYGFYGFLDTLATVAIGGK